MKKYIRASLSESTPDWLRRKLTGKGFDAFKQKFLNRYKVALDRANYTYTPTTNSDIPIYLLDVDYGNVVYSPGVNDDDTASINGRYRKLGSIAKSKLPEMASDVIFLDLNDPSNRATVKERYQDPRYTYRYSKQGKYAGQYKKQDYNYDTGEYEDAGWSEKGMTPSNESRARDKSGYKIPTPESRLTEYYQKYPNKIREKIDSVYDMLIETKQMLVDADFNTALSDRYYTDNIGSAYRQFSDAIYEYRRLLTELDETGSLNDYSIRSFGNKISDIKERIQSVQDLLNS